MEVRLVVISPAKSRKTYTVRLPLLVGRGEDAKFRIQQDSVSRQHCRLSVEDGVVCLTDLGSTNGTLVSGNRIQPHTATPVSSGTELRIGATVVRVEYGEVTATAGRREGDTVSLGVGAAAVRPAAEPATEPGVDELPELEPVEAAEPPAAALPVEEPPPAEVTAAEAGAAAPAFPEVAEPPAAEDVPAFPDVDPAPAAAAGSFDFLGTEPAPPPAADDNLEDFFKSIS